MDNPYLDFWTQAHAVGGLGDEVFTDEVLQRWGFAVPNEAALNLCASYAPLLELGAGSGYWAWLLRQMNVDIVACDKEPPVSGQPPFYFASPYTPVEQADEQIVRQYPERGLLIIWPEDTGWVDSALEAYSGNRLLLVMAEAELHTRFGRLYATLGRGWRRTEHLRLPSWSAEYPDFFDVYMRL